MVSKRNRQKVAREQIVDQDELGGKTRDEIVRNAQKDRHDEVNRRGKCLTDWEHRSESLQVLTKMMLLCARF